MQKMAVLGLAALIAGVATGATNRERAPEVPSAAAFRAIVRAYEQAEASLPNVNFLRSTRTAHVAADGSVSVEFDYAGADGVRRHFVSAPIAQGDS